MSKYLILMIAVMAAGFWVAMIIDAVTNRGVSDTERLMWVMLVVLVTPGAPVGALIYFFYGRPKRRLGV